MDQVTILQLLKAVHLYGVIMWIGGVFTVGVLAHQVGDVEGDKLAVSRASRAALLQGATVGMVLAWLGGLSMFIMQIAVYKTQGWMHGKLLLALIVSGLSGVISGKIRKAANGDAPLDGAKVSRFGRLAMLLAMVVVGLAVFKPGM